jgi:hypothetical protein
MADMPQEEDLLKKLKGATTPSRYKPCAFEFYQVVFFLRWIGHSSV